MLEPDPVLRRVHEQLLELHGYMVLSTPDLDGAITLLHHRPDIRLVVADVPVRERDAEQTYRDLRNCRPDLPRVILSPEPSASEVHCGELGDDVVLCKPADPRELLREIAVGLRRSPPTRSGR